MSRNISQGAQTFAEELMQATRDLVQEMAEVFGDPQVEAILMKHLHQANLDILDYLIQTHNSHGTMDTTAPAAPSATC